MRHQLRRLLSVALSLFLTCALPAETPLPKASELHDPAGHAILWVLHTLPGSVQVYTCRANGSAYSWGGPDPDAQVTDRDGILTINHYKGPTWESVDGSIVYGSKPKHYLATNPDSIDWLDLTATGGTGSFANVDIIHRTNTSGGIPPSQPCDKAHNLYEVRVDYSATYTFYAPN
jgi:hypothetical protein